MHFRWVRVEHLGMAGPHDQSKCGFKYTCDTELLGGSMLILRSISPFWVRRPYMCICIYIHIYTYFYICIYTCIHNTVDICRKQTTFFLFMQKMAIRPRFLLLHVATAAKWRDPGWTCLKLLEAWFSHAPRQCRVADDCFFFFFRNMKHFCNGDVNHKILLTTAMGMHHWI